MLLARRNQNWLPDVFNDFFDTNFIPRVNATAPAINVIERENEYDVELAAPGMTKDDFKVSLDEEQNLVVTIEKKQENEDKKEEGHYLRREFSYTQYHQTLLLPDDVDRDKIEATVNHGVLTVKLPKLTPQEAKRESRAIDIK